MGDEPNLVLLEKYRNLLRQVHLEVNRRALRSLGFHHKVVLHPQPHLVVDLSPYLRRGHAHHQFLERPDGGAGLGVETAVHVARVVAQINESLLETLDGGSLGPLLHGALEMCLWLGGNHRCGSNNGERVDDTGVDDIGGLLGNREQGRVSALGAIGLGGVPATDSSTDADYPEDNRSNEGRRPALQGPWFHSLDTSHRRPVHRNA
ncbi:unannotated protein [freshwater metagenome]|uniref:Unannotated protein n=1 Tax=freshwater metagenome TaxID=449393 RepID=A0A6J6YSC2_9ZZZZ